MFLVDFAKAYDSVQHGFFTAALRLFAMPEAYVQMLSSALRGGYFSISIWGTCRMSA